MTDQDELPTLLILDGGYATRLGELVCEIPKCMLSVAGQPFIHHQLKLIANAGFKRVIICTGHLGAAIEIFVRRGTDYGLDVRYSQDGRTLLGTGGAILKALNMVPENDLAILYGDSYLEINYRDVARVFFESNHKALMTVLRNDGCWGASNTSFEDGRVLKYDKIDNQGLTYVDYGFTIMARSCFEGFAGDNPFDLSDVFKKVVEQEQMGGYEVFTRFYEIGSVQGLQETAEYLSRKRVE